MFEGVGLSCLGLEIYHVQKSCTMEFRVKGLFLFFITLEPRVE